MTRDKLSEALKRGVRGPEDRAELQRLLREKLKELEGERPWHKPGRTRDERVEDTEDLFDNMPI